MKNRPMIDSAIQAIKLTYSWAVCQGLLSKRLRLLFSMGGAITTAPSPATARTPEPIVIQTGGDREQAAQGSNARTAIFEEPRDTLPVTVVPTDSIEMTAQQEQALRDSIELAYASRDIMTALDLDKIERFVTEMQETYGPNQNTAQTYNKLERKAEWRERVSLGKFYKALAKTIKKNPHMERYMLQHHPELYKFMQHPRWYAFKAALHEDDDRFDEDKIPQVQTELLEIYELGTEHKQFDRVANRYVNKLQKDFTKNPRLTMLAREALGHGNGPMTDFGMLMQKAEQIQQDFQAYQTGFEQNRTEPTDYDQIKLYEQLGPKKYHNLQAILSFIQDHFEYREGAPFSSTVNQRLYDCTSGSALVMILCVQEFGPSILDDIQTIEITKEEFDDYASNQAGSVVPPSDAGHFLIRIKVGNSGYVYLESTNGMMYRTNPYKLERATIGFPCRRMKFIVESDEIIRPDNEIAQQFSDEIEQKEHQLQDRITFLEDLIAACQQARVSVPEQYEKKLAQLQQRRESLQDIKPRTGADLETTPADPTVHQAFLELRLYLDQLIAKEGWAELKKEAKETVEGSRMRQKDE